MQSPEQIKPVTPTAPDAERIENLRAGIIAVVLAPIILPVYLALFFIVWSFAADAWSGLRASLGF